MARGWMLYIGARQLVRHGANFILVCAVATGVLALVTVLSIMNGFQADTIENLLQIDSFHFTVDNLPIESDWAALQHSIAEVEGVESVMPFLEIFTLANAPPRSLVSVSVRAVPHNALAIDAGFARQVAIVQGSFDLAENSVVAGSGLLQRLGLEVGDALTLYSHSGARRERIVRGVFRTGYHEFDNSLVFVSLENNAPLFGTDPTVSLGIKLQTLNNDHTLARAIEETVAAFPTPSEQLIELTSWRKSNQAVFAALRLEKLMLILTLGTIFLIVGVNIYQSLKREVTRRSDEIAILKTMGGTARDTRTIFMLQGMVIGITGSALGIAGGLFISNNINNIFAFTERSTQILIDTINWVFVRVADAAVRPLEYIPSIYFFVPRIPNRILLGECVTIFLFGALSAVISALFSVSRIQHIDPCDILRNK